MRCLKLFLALAGSVIFLSSCNNTKRNPLDFDRNADIFYSEFISVYSTGRIKSNDEIIVSLVNEVPVQKQATKNVISLEPRINGEVTWLSAKTLAFKPKLPLTNGQQYVVSLDLTKLGLNVNEEQRLFDFAVEVVPQDYVFEIESLTSDPSDPMKVQILKGSVETADRVSEDELRSSLKATQNSRALTVEWQSDNEGVNHQFVIKGISRFEEASEVDYRFDGKYIGVQRSSKGSIDVPALNDFKVISTKVVKSGEEYLLLTFSDPLDEGQDLNGLIELEDESELRFDITENEVKVYFSSGLRGDKRLSVYPGIRNKLSFDMPEGYEENLSFAQVPPSLRLQTNRTILPSTDGLVLPFEAVNLRAVDVTVIKVFEKNVIQFLQANNLNGENELRRVGKPIHQSRVILDKSNLMDMSEWNNFQLDISDLIAPEPGAIYQVRLGFRKEYSLYGCGEVLGELSAEKEKDDTWALGDGEGQGTWENYYTSNYGDGYNWRETENPCHVSYYMGVGKTVSTNILASNIGLMAKIGNDRSLNAFVTDLRTTDPLSNINLTVYDYQGEVIANARTDNEGRASIDLKNKPFVLMAEAGMERGYLKLWDANSLSVSNFNVGGDRVERGIQGFIYGERGVWRPGDQIYLDFILNDKEDALPDDHPVVMELIDPSGNVKERQVQNQGLNGFYHFPLKTNANAPTGNWLARVSVGGNEFTKKVKIETVKPNRLKIDLDFGEERISILNPRLAGNLQVGWLSGAPARNLKAEFDLLLTPMATTFKGFEDYNFDDEAKSFYSEKERVFSGNVDDKGAAQVNVALGKQSTAPGALRATFSGKVFEPGGDFSIDQFSLPFYPYSQFIGIKKPEGDSRGQLLTNKVQHFDVVAVNPDGEQIQDGTLRLEVFKLTWRWWWDNSDRDISYYVSRNYNSPYLSKEVKLVNGEAKVELEIPNKDWGRYYVRVIDTNSGHSAGTVAYFDWPGWAGKERPGGESMLDFSTDSNHYNVGDEITVKIPASAKGRALISIENGSKVIDALWLETNTGDNEVTFKATAEMAPNIYLNASLLQPHAQTSNDLPMRLYGIIPIEVSDPNSKLLPEITLPQVMEPESQVTVNVSEGNGKAMTYTIAVVDEGLLDITNFKTPDPWRNFYARQALGVKTWDVYDDVIGASKGDLARLLSIGGDGTNAKSESAKANRFESVVKHLGPFVLGAGERASHTFDMPNYIGSVRTMVIAGNAQAYGQTEKATPVRKPLMVLGTLPRVVGPGETIKLPVTVFALEKGVQDVEVSIRVNDKIISGSSRKSIRFDQTGDQTIDFDLEIREELGIAEVLIEARSGNERAVYRVEVDIRNPNPVQTKVSEFVLQSGESLEQKFDPIGMSGTNSTSLELSTIPAIDLSKRLDYLISYPHGCIEQTTSAVFPQLFLSDVMELDDKKQNEINDKVKEGIANIAEFQTSAGGFAYWPGQRYDNDWGTNYGGHFLLEAKDKGYFVPSALISKWKLYQKSKARSWSRSDNNDDIVQAYRLYTLALAQSPELGAMNRLREDRFLSDDAKWRLAAAFALTGRQQVAKELINKADLISKEKERYYYYGSQVRDNAMRLETLGLLNMQNEGVQLLRDVAQSLSDNRWLSTQSTAYALLAVLKFAGTSNGLSGIEANYQLNDDRANLKTANTIVLREFASDQIARIKTENKGSGPLFVRVIQRGQPLKGEELAESNGLKLDVVYTDINGTNIDPTQLEQGQDFFATVTVFNNGTKGVYEDMALTHVFPSGWEILNDRLNELPESRGNAKIDYQDIRDDRVLSYFDLKANERMTFKVALNATYAGSYYLPAVKVEGMYDDTVYGKTKGQRVTVRRAN